MFTLPGLLAILVAHYTKVHEIVDWLRPLPVIHLLYLIAGFGLLLDLRLGLVRSEPCPQLRIILPLWLWSLFSGILAGETIAEGVRDTLVYMLLFLLIAQGVQSFRGLRVLALSVLAISVFLAAVAIVQAQSPFECQLLIASEPGSFTTRPDGRACASAAECRRDAEPGEDYLCERPGPFRTTSVGHGRVRYRGFLEDPNELALALVMSLPLVMIASSRRRTLPHILLMGLILAATLPVVVWSRSRTGQIAFIVVVGVYLVQRLGRKGILIAAVAATPALLLGGRSGEEAAQSTMDRLEAWSAGLEMFRSSPLWGIGRAQFSEHHYLTAHNTFVLEAAELGFVGLVLWSSLLYTGFKIALVALRRYRARPDGYLAYAWARALLASLCGLAVGTSFLSLAYHPVVWTFLALPGAYYLAVRRHDPDFRVRFGVRDLLAVTGFSVVFLAGLKAYLKVRGV